MSEVRAREIMAKVDANELEGNTIARLERLVRHGYKWIDIHVRKDGQEYHFQGDWIARLFQVRAAEPGEWPAKPLTMRENLGGEYARERAGARGEMSDVRDEHFINLVLRDVAELPDRSSPSDAPQMMLITADELRAILENALAARQEFCPKRDEETHCVHWWDGDRCCACGDGPMSDEEKRANGMLEEHPTNDR